MTIRIFWELDAADRPDRAEPSRRPDWSESIRDGRTARGNRAHHYGQIARAAALTGFDGLFFTYRPESDDSQILAASVGRLVPTLELVPEFPASVGSAVYAAKEAVSFQRATHNRLGWAIAPERSAAERRSDGDPVSDEDGLARLEEFLTVARGVHGTRGYDFKGRFFEVEKGGFDEPLSRAPFPQVYLRGLGEERFGLSARQADVHVFDELPIADLRAHIERSMVWRNVPDVASTMRSACRCSRARPPRMSRPPGSRRTSREPTTRSPKPWRNAPASASPT